ncbi:JmjC domain-containing protein [Bermanella sp. WJH001]|uniref:cupin domain-containing protein n=1 Tax=Bermanella sp. WJH001 TaxID=3048005 RepID=UPI0024BEBE8C|nr:cupin domain-containing protein [Bermanella sp. WJH001]MDJ1536998.1 cupin domain-containing protein [Bermanella sp. WJH001]
MNMLGNISIETFLAEYWQKKPLLIRNAFPDYISPIEPDDLAGLAMEEDAESRLIFEHGPNNPWELRHGPFSEDDFANLPEKDWTLLVQAVDQWVPELADLMNHFNFIPKWRLDDLMVSFAPEGGSVGPHFDQYDVFLLQAHGQRHWQIGQKCDDNSPLLKNTELKILSDMMVTDEWTLNPGDMLYIPPQYAHNGKALNDCMTFSIGFRAPSEADIVSHLADHICSSLSDHDRYSDPDISNANQNPALIDDKAIERIQNIINSQLKDPDTLKAWFSHYMTESKYDALHEPLEDPLEWEEIAPFFSQETIITQNETVRWSYYHSSKGLQLVINGEPLNITQTLNTVEMCEKLANQRHTHTSELGAFIDDAHCQEILLNLFNLNYLYFDEE